MEACKQKTYINLEHPYR